MMHEEALQYVDTVVTGEVENIWRQVLQDFENERDEGPRVDLSAPGVRPGNPEECRK
jgi:hypothetical protein